jgi:hypothetical protein
MKRASAASSKKSSKPSSRKKRTTKAKPARGVARRRARPAKKAAPPGAARAVKRGQSRREPGHPHLQQLAAAERLALDALVQRIYEQAALQIRTREVNQSSADNQELTAYAEARRSIVKQLKQWESARPALSEADEQRSRP